MKNRLIAHNGNQNLSIETSIYLTATSMQITFIIKGALETYVFPQKSQPQRANELWKSTCFELFLGNSQKEAYYELNFSSSLAWNFYYLRSYRAELQELKLLSEPKISVKENEEVFKIVFELETETFSFKDFDSYNVASVLLTKEHECTFWSLKAFTDVPDFHHQDNFLKIK
ncbi:MAG: Unknown protein [uncultured Sulfurovum sp.]|uniref:DOMON-like domain-containing protein n=1 Tax=uncultured Sulfurovum sp. TaxID=269237 RepID=A0A6S6T6V2_9BACT|nr:MAG: Unknown protein [uncultured Sulfurovum sp.]